MTVTRCTSELPWITLVDYWVRELSAEEESNVEEHIFACDRCSCRLELARSLGHGIARVASRRGGFPMVVTASTLARLEADDLRTRQYRPVPGEILPCTVGADDDFLVTLLPVDPRTVERVDVEITSSAGYFRRIEDAPIDTVTGQVIYTTSADEIRTKPSTTINVRLLAVTGGEERTLGEYTLEHTGYPSA